MVDLLNAEIVGTIIVGGVVQLLVLLGHWYTLKTRIAVMEARHELIERDVMSVRTDMSEVKTDIKQLLRSDGVK